MTPNKTESQRPDPKKIEGKKPDARPPEAEQPELAQAQTREIPPDADRTQVAQPAPKKAEDKLLDEDWLADKSEEDLVELIFEITLELKARTAKGTEKIAPDAKSLTFTEETDVKEFVRLPAVSKKKPDAVAATTWRIVLVSSSPKLKPLALEIYDDVTIGRVADDVTVDLDLNQYSAEDSAVSRRHALLRPTESTLFLIDLHSTNGTFYNSTKLNPSVAQKLKDGDVISFGALYFKIHIVSSPKKPAP